jgi:hypothetical protein
LSNPPELVSNLDFRRGFGCGRSSSYLKLLSMSALAERILRICAARAFGKPTSLGLQVAGGCEFSFRSATRKLLWLRATTGAEPWSSRLRRARSLRPGCRREADFINRLMLGLLALGLLRVRGWERP